MEQMPTLTDEQVEAYFVELDDVPDWAEGLFQSLLADPASSLKARRVLELGGGTGRHLDAILETYPHSEGVLVDSSEHMIDNNRPHPRKKLFCGNIAELDAALPPDEPFDLINIWYVLHHCIGTSISDTRRIQRNILQSAGRLLSERGRLCVIEVCYESHLVPKFATRMIYHITRSLLLAPLARRFEANTAGTGVLFATELELDELFRGAGLEIEKKIFLENESKGGPLVRAALALKSGCQKAWILRRA